MTAANSPVYEAHFVRTPFQLLGGMKWKKLVALRVDGEGVLLGGAPARYERQLAFVPWQDITSIVVWHQRTAGNGVNHIGVQRKPGAPALPGMNSGVSRETAAMLAPHVDYELLLASRPINFWRLAPERLQAAVDAFAPHVPVLVYSQPHLS
ncbi:hypothetical protein AQI95_07085 [Streptomyces yokosukanensis]|uniref:Uncharacterized protein n=1 Tax=Streptomyces yokosukanensis TaxID=67386 RepID=A0A101PC39_9ACTN|nr:hypothetical protein [Streptomyces yokosukanensis]KUN08768.1 hypothetical protein AQI95_07085 [Streptomyces yokosukanensis]